MKVIALDFETFYIKPSKGDPGYSVQSLGNWRYTHDEQFDAYMVSVCDGEQALACEPADFDWECLAGCTLLSHNAAFDMAVYERLVELGKVPRVEFAAWHCTANMTSYLCNRRSLAEATKHLLGIKVSKSEREGMNNKTWDQAKQEGIAEALTEYAKNDVRYCWQLWDKFSEQWPEHERKLSELTIRQSQNGIAINTALLESYHKLVKTALWHLEGDLPWTESGAKPTSTKAIAEECRKVGIPTPPVKAHEGEEAFEEWENTYGPRFPWVAGVTSWRSLNRVLGSFETIQNRLRPDGTIDFSLLYFGGHTGRWAGGGSSLNLQNLLKDSLVFHEGRYIGKKLDLEKAGRTGDTELNIRHLFVPRPGKKFVIADASQIEPRILNWVAGNFELLAKIAQGFSYYEAYAATFEGWEGEPGTLKKSISNEVYTKLKNKCIAEGTLVLTDSGYKRIERVLASDSVWDGHCWVSHGGLIFQGFRDTVCLSGESFTEDHEIYIEERTKECAGAMDKRKQAAAMAWRKPPGSDWSDLWKLARAVVSVLSEEGLAVSGVLVSRVREASRRLLSKLSIRSFAAVPVLWGKEISKNKELSEVGEGNR